MRTKEAKGEEEDRARPAHQAQPEEGQSKEQDLREDRFRRQAIAWRDNHRERQEQGSVANQHRVGENLSENKKGTGGKTREGQQWGRDAFGSAEQPCRFRLKKN